MRTATILRSLAAMVLSFTVATVNAATPRQKLIDEYRTSNHPIYFGDTTVITSQEEQAELLRKFYENQFRQFSDPMAPYFMMMSRDGKLAMGVGGVFALHERYDWHGVQNSYDFITYNIPTDVAPNARHGFGTSVAGTKVFATVMGRYRNLGFFKVYVEGKFNESQAFVLGKAYATLSDWTVGYDSSTFCDGAAHPGTVDGQGPNSYIDHTNVLVRWMHTFKDHYVVAASMETPSTMIPKSQYYEGCSNFMPSFAAFAQYQWEGMHQHVRLSGIVRGLEYRNLVSATNHKVVGWGLHLSTVFNPTRNLTVFGSVQGGRGISALVNDLQEAPLDLAPRYGVDGKMFAPGEVGWYAALQYSWNPKVYSTLIFSQERYFAGKQATAGNDIYRSGYYATANVFYHPVPRATFGIEYNYGYRTNYDRVSGHMNRVQMLFQFDF
ncbi:MAG: hypothetical protein K2M98_07690 [Muribaculum sp.]|nr:hypothetical protein [Muribaculum sp.]